MKLTIAVMGIAGMLTFPAMAQVRIVRGVPVPRTSPEWTPIRDKMEVVAVEGKNLAVRTFTEEDQVTGAGGTGNGQLWPVHHLVKTYHETFAITNYPSANAFTRGSVIRGPILLMRVGNVRVPVSETETGTETTTRYVNVPLYDYGTDYVPPPKVLTAKEAEQLKASSQKASESAAVATFNFHQRQALAGNAGSQFRLGQLYLEGKGCSSNTNEARVWFRKAAAQGNEDAIAQLKLLE